VVSSLDVISVFVFNRKAIIMNLLFFVVHPSKFHVFRHTINILKQKGHQVNIIITSKDVLEKLVINEGWAYTNIFPEGRKISWLPTKIGAGINLIRTIFRIKKYIKRSDIKYDLFITDDLLVINGWLNKIPTFHFQDDDITAVPESALIMFFANYIISPTVSNLGKYQKKKIGFYGYKELGSFHPARFTPDYEKIKQFNPEGNKYFLLRLVSLRAVHDAGKSGLKDNDVLRLINKLEEYGNVYITAERHLPPLFEKYRITINPNDIAHALFFAEFLISDSQTMSAESGVLGTPYIRYNDFVERISYLDELEKKYELGFGIKTKNKDQLFEKIDYLLSQSNLKETWRVKRNKMLSEKIDLTEFLVWLIEGFPESVSVLQKDLEYQKRFIKKPD
jgi:uncharacterized protein